MADAPPDSSAARPAALAPEIDLLRGVAALGVLLFHSRVALWVGWREIQQRPADFSAFERAVAWLAAPTPFLGAGVMLFFVISGFCVHQPLAAANSTPSWRSFYARRLLRVYPPYLAAVVVSAAATVWLGLSAQQFGASAAMVQNYTGPADASALVSQILANPSLWSLPVEMEFYLLYPLVWWAVARLGWGLALSAVAALSLAAAAAVLAGHRVLDGNFALYWLIWCSGAWLRERHARGALARPPILVSVAALGAIAAGVVCTLRPVGPLATLAWGAGSFWLVWQCLSAPRKWPAWLSRPLRAAGAWSYSLYLLHFPLLLLLGAAWTALFGEKPANFLVTLAGCVVVLGPVILFHRWVEQPSHAWARRWAR